MNDSVIVEKGECSQEETVEEGHWHSAQHSLVEGLLDYGYPRPTNFLYRSTGKGDLDVKYVIDLTMPIPSSVRPVNYLRTINGLPVERKANFELNWNDGNVQVALVLISTRREGSGTSVNTGSTKIVTRSTSGSVTLSLMTYKDVAPYCVEVYGAKGALVRIPRSFHGLLELKAFNGIASLKPDLMRKTLLWEREELVTFGS